MVIHSSLCCTLFPLNSEGIKCHGLNLNLLCTCVSSKRHEMCLNVANKGKGEVFTAGHQSAKSKV